MILVAPALFVVICCLRVPSKDHGFMRRISAFALLLRAWNSYKRARSPQRTKLPLDSFLFKYYRTKLERDPSLLKKAELAAPEACKALLLSEGVPAAYLCT